MSHSTKVGGAFEFFARHGQWHEGQQFTGHKSIKNVARYGMLMDDISAAHTLVEIQQPPLYHKYGILSTRQLQAQLLKVHVAHCTVVYVMCALQCARCDVCTVTCTLRCVHHNVPPYVVGSRSDFKLDRKS